MAQTVVMPVPQLHSYIPSSPDPTPLRMIAFSVAEAALMPDPNSPSLNLPSQPRDIFRRQASDDTDTWKSNSWSSPWDQPTLARSTSAGTGGLWDVVERAKGRRFQGKFPSPLPPSPPISPAAYTFNVPANSHLAASIDPSNRPFPLFTRSAANSPIKSTFEGLDQSRPPPEFVPRLSAQDFVQKAVKQSTKAKHTRTKSDIISPVVEAVPPSQRLRPRALPSLAQIQAKMSTGERRASFGNLARLRTGSTESVEVLKTPIDENGPRRDPRVVLQGILNRRPPTPPSPAKALAPFLRQRTSGRLAGGRPVSMPPVRSLKEKPVLQVTPPSVMGRTSAPVPVPQAPPSPAKCVTPTRAGFPWNTTSTPNRSPGSPSSVPSPTLSVPIITCTPAPARLVKDGVEGDSDEEEGEVVVFDAETDRDERERRGQAMKERLMLRRLSN